MKKLPLYALLLLIAISCAKGSTDKKHAGESDDLDNVEAVWTPGEAPMPKPVGKFSRYTTDEYTEIFNDSNYIQYEAAERMGIEPMYDLKEAYHTKRPLVKIESNEDYTIDRLTHSMPFLVPEAARLLEEIGKEFREEVVAKGGGKDTRFIVTSLLRSPYSVKKLRRVNKNAVDSSTHMFATTFDISWNNYNQPDSLNALRPEVLKQTLADVLLKKRNEGRCYVKYEKKTPCFHITVNK